MEVLGYVQSKKEENALHACLGQDEGLFQEPACLQHRGGDLWDTILVLAWIWFACAAVVSSWDSLSSAEACPSDHSYEDKLLGLFHREAGTLVYCLSAISCGWHSVKNHFSVC